MIRRIPLFGKNEIVGKKYFRQADGKYLVTSIFFTLQGEGPLAGYPAVFIRLAKCNLACSFCDTYFDSGDWLSINEIEQKIWRTIDDHFSGWIPDWVLRGELALIITGGEPSLQNLYPLLSYFSDFKATQIESNGIIYTELPSSTLLVVSPKCTEKRGKVGNYIMPHKDTLERADCLKFVISADHDSPYYRVPQWALEWKEAYHYKDIFVSPMNIYNEEPQAARTARNSNQTSLEQRSTVEEVISFWTPGLLNLEANQKNHEWAADYCITHGLRLNLQMHLYCGKA